MANFISAVGRVVVRPALIRFKVETNNVKVAKEAGDVAVRITQELGSTSVKLGTIYAGYQLVKPPIDAAVTRACGGPRDDQENPEIRPGCLHVLLRCLTDKRFLEVLEDYESGKIKQRLQKELSQVGFEVEGLTIEIENMEEVNKIKAAINERYGNQYWVHKSLISNINFESKKKEKLLGLYRFITFRFLGFQSLAIQLSIHGFLETQ